MRTTTFLRIVLVVAGIAGATIGTDAIGKSTTGNHKQSAIVHFTNPTLVAGEVLAAGEYLIVHDDDKMARGGPCTTFFCLDADKGWTEAVSFYCRPVDRDPVDRTSLDLVTTTVEEYLRGSAVDKLIEYQFAGDT